MVLIADIGNSSITVGLFRVNAERSHDSLVCKSKYSTDTRKSADEYAAEKGCALYHGKHVPLRQRKPSPRNTAPTDGL